MRQGARLVVSVNTLVLLLLLPAFAIFIVFLNVARDGKVTDLENTFLPAAEAIMDGSSPYPSLDDPVIAAGKAYVYPPVTAILSIPLTPLSTDAAGFLTMALLYGCVFATLLVLGVRDWRCYGMACLWPPVISAVQTGNITIPLGLAAALAWRFRERVWVVAASVGLSLAAKLFVWPLLIWLWLTGRRRGAVAAVAVSVVVVLVSWAVIGFDGLRAYPDLLRALQSALEPESYTVYALLLDLGVPHVVSRVAGLAVALAALVSIVVMCRRGDDRRAFALGLAAAIAVSPLVWLHYFALLLVAVAVLQPRLGLAWFAPLLLYFSTGTHNGATWQTALTLGAAALTFALALAAPASARPAVAVQARPLRPAAERPL